MPKINITTQQQLTLSARLTKPKHGVIGCLLVHHPNLDQCVCCPDYILFKKVNKALGTKLNIEKDKTYCTEHYARVCVENSKQELALMDIWTLQALSKWGC